MGRVPVYTDGFKAELVQLAKSGRSLLSLQLEYGVDRSAIKKWVYKAKLKQERASIIQKCTPASLASHTVLAIPDLHHPFAHADSLAFLKAVKNKFHPTRFVCLGDEIDAHAFSRWPMDPDGLSAGQELRQAIEALTPFYLEFPDMLVCESNHTIRPWKKAFESGLPAAFLPTFAKILNAPDGWKWRDFWLIDGVRYFHGEGKSGQNAHLQFLKAYKQSIVHGHIHTYAAVSWEGKNFAMNAGCLIDTAAYAFKYAKNMPIAVSLGCGVIIDGKRAFWIPMILDDVNRWTGQL